MFQRLALFAVLAVLSAPAFAAGPEVDAVQLPRVPATPPERALSTFKVKPGFQLELVAAEPLVIDPIALSFDEDGRCYVVEMRDYSERRPERLGRIVRLEDTDGDGRFDKSTVFAPDLPWPTAVICWDGGVFVGATPDLIYFKDTNGDGVADIREPIFTGFAADYAPFATNKLNVQALMNSFNWSLDNRIHGATSFNGGKVKRVDSPFVREWLKRAGSTRIPKLETRSDPLELRGRDFSFDPRTLEMRAESGGGQYGMSFDNSGRKFVCSNSSHIQTLMYEERYAARNPHYSMPRALVDIAVDGGAAPVFRISPDEPWRVIRTQWRVSGLVPGPIEGGGRPSGYFTGATGITIYRGDAYGPEFVGDAFVGDAGGNLVHRKKIVADGVGVKAVRPADEEKVEFLASTDNWFRPVQMANAPDGCLYICDMYREVIEHPWSLPESLKKHLDLNSGNDRGRIYRVVPEKFKPRPLPRLSKASTAELVKMLEHPNGWHRDTAARLIFERLDKSAVTKLVEMITPLNSSYAVTHALHGLTGLDSLAEEHVRYALWHGKAAVREQALKLAESFLAKPSKELEDGIRRLVERAYPDQETASGDLQLAFTLGAIRNQKRSELLWEFLKRRTDPAFTIRTQLDQNDYATWIEPVALGEIQDDAFSLFASLVTGSQSAYFGSRKVLLCQLARAIGAHQNKKEIEQVLTFATNTVVGRIAFDVFSPDLPLASGIVIALDEGLRQRDLKLHDLKPATSLKAFHSLVRPVALGDVRGNTEEARVAAIRALATAPHSEIRADLSRVLFSMTNSPKVQLAAVETLSRFSEPTVGHELLEAWHVLLPGVRSAVISALLQRPERMRALMAAMEKGLLNPAELSVAQRTQLRSHRDSTIREQAEKVFGRAPTGSRQTVVEAFQPALVLRGAAVNGLKTFQARCATCHKLGAEGHLLGPDLATVKNGGKEKLLTSILDPNREVNSNYLGYTVETKDGENFSGLIVNENANSVTVRMAGGAETIVARANIASMQSQGRSLMPDGLEEGLSAQDMADLLEFILAP